MYAGDSGGDHKARLDVEGFTDDGNAALIRFLAAGIILNSGPLQFQGFQVLVNSCLSLLQVERDASCSGVGAVSLPASARWASSAALPLSDHRLNP